MDQDTGIEALAARIGASRSETLGLLVVVAVAGVILLALWWWQRPSDIEAPVTSGAVELTGAEVVVHVTGAVRTPGVVTTVDGARIVDVLSLAGGASPDADLSGLNLARVVVDGEQIIVPRQQVRAPGEPPPPAALDQVRDADGRININRATEQDLQELPGVGPVLARRIVQHREANGLFRLPGDLRAVAGIGEKTFQSIAPMIWV